jgi:adenosylcobinamide kinase/adenosylcobinamide-phosphate guanylyltransferase
MTGKIILIGGGVRSGKSSLSVKLGLELGQKRAFIATATRSDDEMRARIQRHIDDRGGSFETVEAPLELAEALRQLSASTDVVVVDCITHWLSNMLLQKLALGAMLERVDEVVGVLEARRFHSVLVTNEVGMSIHPPSELGRAFVELCGFAHQRLARAADEVHLAVLGTHFRIKPQPFASGAAQ